ncbi:MAG: NAD(P)-dependent oxidoreductase [Candidatus Omnitrophica bacterium]|nr:NAD(P)-dependent oxidoreductase [Candidatus Omnitrophota bacterium]
MKVAVCGGSGFLGSHVADALQDQGHEVRIFDLRTSPYLRPGQEMVVGDILDEGTVGPALEGCEAVYHFAGIADIDEANRQPAETVRANVLGTTLLLEACRAAGVRRFLYASTVYVQSHAGGFYRCSKQASELYIEAFQQAYGLPYTVLRYGSLYGPRAAESNAVQRYLTQALLHGKIEAVGDGEEVREYIHVEDAARNSVEALAPDYENQYVVLTGHQPMTVKALLEMIEEILNKKVAITFQGPDALVHYRRTPYAFQPKVAKKLVGKYYLDLGQGLLACLSDIHERERAKAAIAEELR